MDLIILRVGIILTSFGLTLLIALWIAVDIIFKKVKIKFSKKVERVIYIITLSPIALGVLLVAYISNK
jgi:hypothetical protein